MTESIRLMSGEWEAKIDPFVDEWAKYVVSGRQGPSECTVSL